MAYRVIQWATGHTGKMAVRATAERPDYEIVGAFTYSADKVGEDLGTLSGTRALGIPLTNERQKILDTPADCVLFLAGADLDLAASFEDVCALLRSGKNVIATASQFVYVKSMGPAIHQAVRDACAAGNATFHGLGVAPGFFMESLPLLMTRLARRTSRLIASETLAYDQYPSTFQMFDLMGFGYEPDDPTPVFHDIALAGENWRHSALLMADTLDLPIDRIEPFRNIVLADRDLQVAAGLIRAGTVAAMNFGARVISNGRERIVLQHFTRMSRDLAPDWPSGDGWIVQLEGEPSITVKTEISGGLLATDDACMATAMHAVHAVPYTIAAAPGILTLADAPPVWGKDAFHLGG